MSIWTSFLRSLGFEFSPWPRKYRECLDEAWEYAEKALSLTATKPRIIILKAKAESMVKGQYTAPSPNGVTACGWYSPESEAVVLVVGGPRDDNLYLQENAQHELAHHILWRNGHISGHPREWRNKFRAWNLP
jgi:hypothetical protein